ncbi:alkaline-shock protein [Companilactobacillus crustorum]|uniref:Stress response regulator gls24 homolog n=3 Tax=Companilactobacillus TaxID=2767879 RepID=A0A837RHZ3_9LACO|nr:Asp23/Gls24 family envelope stress response protein [Companilactobacillus crustorum]HCD07219.1 Asp23/Gls24 family envelope stress response protein [Lactobacillus sp.]APU72384.1 Alkaline shock protein 23 [Companilactobacillus crustorum]KRK41798.1 general stress protein [Companilactobacillus crustorum JCM 15951]KRO20662.1 general stress protein [Companilactobacillus crustorum]WDT65572.1 Asp23/Gls24 family envelope stress response protein [Companilactobacillus crustorum]
MPNPQQPNPKENSIQKELNFSDKVLEKIANHTAQSIDGVLSLTGGTISDLTDRFMNDPTKGVDVNTDDDKISFELKAILEYGKSAPQIFEKVTASIARSVKEMTGKDVNKIVLNIDDLMTASEWKNKNNKNDQKEDEE